MAGERGVVAWIDVSADVDAVEWDAGRSHQQSARITKLFPGEMRAEFDSDRAKCVPDILHIDADDRLKVLLE